MLYDIFAGLVGDGYNGATYQDTIDCDDVSEATEAAREVACKMFDESGIYDEDQLLEEDSNLTEEDLLNIYMDMRESYIEYYVDEFEYEEDEEYLEEEEDDE